MPILLLTKWHLSWCLLIYSFLVFSVSISYTLSNLFLNGIFINILYASFVHIFKKKTNVNSKSLENVNRAKARKQASHPASHKVLCYIAQAFPPILAILCANVTENRLVSMRKEVNGCWRNLKK